MSEKADVMGYGDRSSGEQTELEFKGRNEKEKAADMNTPTYKPCQLNATADHNFAPLYLRKHNIEHKGVSCIIISLYFLFFFSPFT